MEKGELIKQDAFPVITAEDVRKFFCPTASEKEVAMFLQIAKMNQLSPFKREIFIVKYGNNAASILTGYEVYLKRAERSGHYGGFKVWIEGKVPDMIAKIEVYRKDWDKPLCHEVDYSEYVGTKADGTPTRFWKTKAKTMLKKVVISQAMRFAFPDELAGMPYTQDEINPVEVEVIQPKSNIVEPRPIQESHQKPSNVPILNDNAPVVSNHAETAKVQETVLNTISEPQQRRIFALLKKAGINYDSFKQYLKVAHNFEHTADIPKGDKYAAICAWIETPVE